MKQFFDNIAKQFYLYKKRHPKRVMTFLVFIVIPLVTGLILGYEMSSNVAANIPTVIVDHDNSDFSRSFIEYVDESEYFDVVEYADRDERVEEMLDKQEAFVGVIIPKDLYSDMKEGKAPQILTVYDGSTLVVISSARSAMSEILLTVKTAYMMKIYEGKLGVAPADVMNHALPIDVTFRMLFNPARNYRNFLLPGMLAALIQVGIVCMGAERASEMRDSRIAFPAHLKTIFYWGVLGAFSISLTILEQYLLFGIPYKGTLLGGIVVTLLFSTVILGMGYIVGSVITDRVLASQLAAVVVLPTTILGGYTWPTLAMPAFFQQLAKILPFYYYGEAIRDLCLKPLQFHHLYTEIFALCVFAAVETGVLYLIKRKGVMV